MTDKTKRKLQSRKFLAWLVWLGLTLLGIIGYALDIVEIPLQSIIQWFGGITMIWIGVEGGIDAIAQSKRGPQR